MRKHIGRRPPRSAIIAVAESLDARQLLSGTFSLAVDKATADESVGSLNLTVSRSSGSGAATVQLSRIGGTMSSTSGVDYSGISFPNTLSFAAGEKLKTIRLSIVDDNRPEPDETIKLALVNPTGGTIGSASSVNVKILDNDALFTFGASTFTVGEGAGTLQVPILRTGSVGHAQQVTIRNLGGTATAPGDYTLGTQTVVSFAAGQTTASLAVPIVNDNAFEGDEHFDLQIAPNGTPQTGAGPFAARVTIVDNDGAPQLAVHDATIHTVNGTRFASFQVTKSGATNVPATVQYATANGTAIAGQQYVAASGALTFAAGEASTTVEVGLLPDVAFHAGEAFFLNLSAPSGASLADGQGVATLPSVVGAPVLRIGGASAVEGNSGTKQFLFPVSLTGTTTLKTVVAYATSNGSATTADGDFVAASGTLTFLPGETSKTVAVTVNGDAKYEPDETFAVALTAPVNASIGTASATGTIRNDDALPALSGPVSTQNEPRVTESAGFANFVVTRSGTSALPVTVAYRTVDGTARAGEDYATVSGVLTFAANDVTQTVRVPILNDARFEPTESFTLVLSNAANATLVGATSTGTIVDDDALPSLSVAPITVVEGDSGTTNATFTVTRNGSSSANVVVNYATQAGTATAGSDFNAVSGTLTFAPGGPATQTVLVPIVGDRVAEATEAFAFVLSNVVGGTIATPSTAGTIQDNDGGPSLAINDVSVSENAGHATFTVTLAGNTALPVTAHYATANGTATSPADFAATSGTISFAAGAHSATIVVPIVNDALHENAEQFTVALTQVVNATLADASGTGTIVDDDAAPALSIGDASVLEGNSGTTNATLTVSLGGAASALPVTVHYATRDGTATAASFDYGTGSGTLTFLPGVTTQTISVVVRGDVAFEPDETAFVDLSTPTNATIADGTGQVTIRNDDAAPPAPTLTVNSTTVAESAGQATFTVSLAGTASGPVTVNYATANGTAVAGSDYAATSGSLTFPVGTTARTVVVPILNDAVHENAETFTLMLSGATGATIATTNGTGTITDDDAAPTLSIGDASVLEGNSGTTNATLTVSLAGNATSLPVTVTYATRNGTATAGSDYNAGSGTLTIPAGTRSGTIVVGVRGDTVYESDETFFVDLNGAANASVGDGTGQVTIRNDDAAPPGPTLSVKSPSATEGQESPDTTFITFAVTLAGTPAGPVTVHYATADGTAKSGEDYDSASGTLTFANGPETQYVKVALEDDDVYENAESFTLVLSAPTNATIATGTGTGTIVDDDAPPTFGVFDEVDSVPEGNPPATNQVTFTVYKDGDTEVPATVSYATVDGTAHAGSDYVGKNGTLSFAANETSKSVVVNVTADTTYEPDETFSLKLSNATKAIVSQYSGTATATIINDDGAPTTLTLGANDVTVSEAAGNATFTVTLTGGPASGPVTVSYATQDDSAKAGSDYSSRNGTVAFGVGETTKTVVVPILEDTVSEPSEHFSLILSNATGGATIASNGNATIVDDDVLTFYVSDTTVSESAGTASFQVSFVGDTSFPVTLSYTTADNDGSAQAGSDFVATNGTLTFDDSHRVAYVPVQIIDDAVAEPTETFRPYLTAEVFPYVVTIVNPKPTGTILDDDALPSFYFSDSSAQEGNPPATNQVTFTVQKGGDAALPSTVSYATSDGTAIAGSDYTATHGTLAFAANETSKTIVVNVIADTTYEPDETFTLTLSNPTNATLPYSKIATGTIINDDFPTLDIVETTVNEGDGTGSFAVTLSQPSSETITATIALADDDAVRVHSVSESYEGDYDDSAGPAGQTVVFAPGETIKYLTFTLNDDATYERREDFFAVVKNFSSNVVIASIPAVAVDILDNDPPPTIFPDQTTYTAYYNPSAPSVVHVTLDSFGATSIPATVRVKSDDFHSTATYTAVDQVVTFDPGSGHAYFDVTLAPNNGGGKIIYLTLFEPTDAQFDHAGSVEVDIQTQYFIG